MPLRNSERQRTFYGSLFFIFLKIFNQYFSKKGK